MTPILADSATAGQATFEPDDDDDDEPDEDFPDSPLFPLDEPEEPEDSEPLLLDESDLDELSELLRDLSFEPSAAGTVEPLRLSVR
jgi:hypothetical protein